MRQALRFRRRQLMPRPADGLWDLAKVHEVKVKRSRMAYFKLPRRYWVDPERWVQYEAPFSF